MGARNRPKNSSLFEQIQVTKHELESANDELGAINSALQLKNEELTEAYNKLSESELRFRLMVEGVRDYAIFFLDEQGFITTWNEGAARLKGYEATEIIGQHFSRFYTTEDQVNKKPNQMLNSAAEQGRSEDEGWRVRRDGTRFWADVILTRINAPSGQILGFAKVTRDLTERKRIEELVLKANESLERKVEERTLDLQRALAVRHEFLSTAAHELKTPLTSLKLQLQLSLRNLSPNSKSGFNVKDLAKSYALPLRQVNALNDLVDYLLDTTRIHSGKLTLSDENVDLSAMTLDVIQRFTDLFKSANCTVEFQLEPRLSGRWDRTRVEQVIGNLLSNAIKYAPGSTVSVRTVHFEKWARLIVQDFGPGIEKDKLPLIFERFERVHPDKNIVGFGLGLFIVKRIVEAHRGRVMVESEPGKGTQFIVDLPR